MDDPALAVREMTLDEVDLRIDYFHDADDEFLKRLGVSRSLLPSPEAWRRTYEVDFGRPIEQRCSYSLLWLLGEETVGSSSTGCTASPRPRTWRPIAPFRQPGFATCSRTTRRRVRSTSRR